VAVIVVNFVPLHGGSGWIRTIVGVRQQIYSRAIQLIQWCARLML
jgi:hypothetical protein